MKKKSFIFTLFLFSALSCDVSSVGEDPCENFFICNEGIFEGDGEEGGIVDRYVLKIGSDLVAQTEDGRDADALIVFYYKFEDHPSFDVDCFHESSFRKVEYTIDLITENELALSNRQNGSESRFVSDGTSIRWAYTEATIILHKSDIDLDGLETCG